MDGLASFWGPTQADRDAIPPQIYLQVGEVFESILLLIFN